MMKSVSKSKGETSDWKATDYPMENFVSEHQNLMRESNIKHFSREISASTHYGKQDKEKGSKDGSVKL